MLDKYDTERRTVISSLVFHQNRMDTSGVNSSAAGQQDSNNGHHNGMDSEEILDNPVSLSSAVVSGDYTADSYSRDLLMIAPQSKTEIGPDDPRFVVPPLVQTSKMTPKITVYSSTDDENEGDTLLTSWQSDLKSPRREELVKYFGYTKNQWFAFVTLAIANIFATAIFSIQAPFYPREVHILKINLFMIKDGSSKGVNICRLKKKEPPLRSMVSFWVYSNSLCSLCHQSTDPW